MPFFGHRLSRYFSPTLELFMTETEIKSLLAEQRAYYKSGKTLPISFRMEQLKKL